MCLRQHLPAEARLGVALSGGRDSVVLLHLAQTLLPAGHVHALHIHHGLSPQADAWRDFCRSLCARWKIPLAQQAVEVDSKGEGVEAAARIARYRALRELCRENGLLYLALAHHRRDQAETLLLNLCRGAGVAGAAAMPLCRVMDNLTLLRPLLGCGFAEMTAYAADHRLRWIEDESNADTRFRRNFLRHRILPPLRQIFPAVETTLARAAGHFAEAGVLLAELAAEDDARIQDQLAPFRCLSPARQSNWLRYRLHRLGWQAPEADRLAEALRQLTEGAHDTQFELRLPEGRLRLWRARFYWQPHALETAPPEACRWSGAEALPWAGGSLSLLKRQGAGLDPTRIAGKMLEVRPRQGGERLRPGPGSGSRPLKKLLQEAPDCPPWLRARLPLIYCDDTLIACPGIALAADWCCAPEAEGLWPEWRRPS
ncbi:MAG: tRNA lysidine(34) synthetase TilS [Zoogloeaceae bacterium]|jgi:tRNA(Ile)-lysidine synthase|nr:tRNA lysidine(34) synthetase TilS [Zoogloeaceae bacterium]